LTAGSPRKSFAENDPVRLGCGVEGGVEEAFDDAVEVVAAVEAPGEAGEIGVGVFGADGVVGAGKGGLDVAE